MVIFYVYARAGEEITILRSVYADRRENLRTRGKKLRKRSYAYMRIRYGPKKSQPYPAQPGLTWRNQFLLVTQPT